MNQQIVESPESKVQINTKIVGQAVCSDGLVLRYLHLSSAYIAHHFSPCCSNHKAVNPALYCRKCRLIKVYIQAMRTKLMRKGRDREVLIYPSASPQALARVWTAVCLQRCGAKSSSASSQEDKSQHLFAVHFAKMRMRAKRQPWSLQ